MTFRERRRVVGEWPLPRGWGRRASCWQRRPQIAFAVCWSDAAWSSSRCDIARFLHELAKPRQIAGGQLHPRRGMTAGPEEEIALLMRR